MRNATSWAAALSVAVVLAWAVASPYVFIAHLRSAAERSDTETLRELVDFPAVRESLKGELNVALTQAMETELEDNPFAGLGIMLAGALVDRTVELYVSPEGIAGLARGESPDPSSTGEKPAGQAGEQAKPIYRYCGPNRFEVAFPREVNGAEAAVLVLRRSGLSWKLTAIRLPALHEMQG